MALLPGQWTLANLRTLIRQECDMVNSQFITDAEFNSYIAYSQLELYDLLVQKYGNDYYSALDSNANEYRITTDGVNDHFKLPDGSATYTFPDASTCPPFYKLLGVDLYLNGTNKSSRINVYPFSYAERNKFSAPNLPAWGGRLRLQYRLEGGVASSVTVPAPAYLWLVPLPSNGQTVGVRYVPRLTPVANDTDVADGVSGWEEYIVVDVAIKALAKEESDPSVMMARKMALLKRIEEASENRDVGSPATVADVRDDFGRGGSWGPWSGGPY